MKYLKEIFTIYRILDDLEAKVKSEPRLKKRSMWLLTELRIDISTAFKHLEDINR